MLIVITGCMFSGKTDMLISMAVAHQIAHNKVEVFKPAKDKRYDAVKIVSHNGRAILSHPIGTSTQIISILGECGGANVICIDEVQFFKPENILRDVNLLLRSGRTIICAGLAQDSFGKSFGAMPELLARADKIIHLTAVCVKCKSIGEATRTYRRGNSTAQVVVGGAELYEPRCYKCWSE